MCYLRRVRVKTDVSAVRQYETGNGKQNSAARSSCGVTLTK
jgi:hypothetical protein